MTSRSTLTFGVLGCSRVALKNVLPAMHAATHVTLGMVGSRDVTQAQRVAAQFHCSRWCGYDDVLADPSIDAVYISLPNALHEAWAVKAAQAGKHVICKKPAGISYTAAQHMVTAAQKNHVRIMEGLMFRYHPQHATVKKLLATKAGNLIRMEGFFGFPMPQPESTMMQHDLAGGVLHACGPYPIYASRMLFQDEPQQAYCHLTTDPHSGVDVRAELHLQYPHQRSALLAVTFGSYFHSTYRVLGERALITATRAYAIPNDMTTTIQLDQDDTIRKITIPPANHFQLMLDDFAQTILNGETTPAPMNKTCLPRRAS